MKSNFIENKYVIPRAPVATATNRYFIQSNITLVFKTVVPRCFLMNGEYLVPVVFI
jgi:hypothetical protein